MVASRLEPDLLADTGLRATPQRQAVMAVIARDDAFVSVRQVYAELVAAAVAVGLSTVYRCLRTLSEAHLLDTVRSETGEVLYRRHCTDCEEHLVCRSCGATIDVGAGPVESWARSTAEAHGFTDVAYNFELFGTCPRCLQRQTKP